MDDLRSRGPSVSRAPASGAGIVFVAFALFSIWQVGGGASLNHLAKRFTDWLMRGWVDPFVSSFGPLAEPQFATVLAFLLAAVLAVVRGWRVAALAVGGLAPLAAAGLGLRAGFGLFGGFVSRGGATRHGDPP